VVAIAVAAGGVGAAADRRGGAARRDDTNPPRGSPPSPILGLDAPLAASSFTRPAQALLAHAGATGPIALIGENAGLGFYRIAGAAPCYAEGAVARPRPIGLLECGLLGDDPLDDMSSGVLDPATGRLLSLVRVAGLAADGVAAIALHSADGAIAATVPVVDNTYVVPAGQLPKGVEGLVALDAGGGSLAQVSFATGS
jgi:hypothetical protein